MTLDEAIVIKEDTLYGRYLHHHEEIEAADKLGIEALKRIKIARDYSLKAVRPSLPGETED